MRNVFFFLGVFLCIPFAAVAQPRAQSTFTPPACTAPGPFADVPYTSPFCPWIQQLAADSITAGCGNGNFCPESPFTRQQAAVMIELAMRGTATWTPAEDAFGSTILVKGNGTPEENGARLRQTLEAAVGQLNVWTTVQLEQGTFDIGSDTLTVREYVILRGAGRLATKIVGGGAGVEHVLVETSQGSRLERLWLHDLVSSTSNIVVKAEVTSAMSDVLISAHGATGQEVTGIMEVGGGGRFEVNDLTVDVAGTPGTGIVLIDDWDAILNRLTLYIFDQLGTAALRLGSGIVAMTDSTIWYAGSSGSAIEISDGRLNCERCEVYANPDKIAVKIPTTGSAYLKNSHVFGGFDISGGELELRDTIASGFGKANFAGSSKTRIIETEIDGGIVLSDTASLEIDRSTLKGYYGIENSSSSTVRIGASKLTTFLAPTGTVKCVASYDGNYDAIGNDCLPIP